MVESCVRSPTVSPRCSPRPAYVVDFLPVPICRCSSSSCERMLASAWIVNALLPVTPEIAMIASDVHERVEHLLHGLHHPGIGAVGGLQDQEVRHLRVDADGGRVVEALLQG